ALKSVALVLCFWIAFAEPPAFAQPPTDAELKALHNRAEASFQAKHYAKALAVAKNWAKGIEKAETAAGKARGRTADALGIVAWYALFARQPRAALQAAERAHELAPDTLSIETNRAHALLFLGRNASAMKAYLGHKGEIFPDQSK